MAYLRDCLGKLARYKNSAGSPALSETSHGEGSLNSDGNIHLQEGKSAVREIIAKIEILR